MFSSTHDDYKKFIDAINSFSFVSLMEIWQNGCNANLNSTLNKLDFNFSTELLHAILKYYNPYDLASSYFVIDYINALNSKEIISNVSENLIRHSYASDLSALLDTRLTFLINNNVQDPYFYNPKTGTITLTESFSHSNTSVTFQQNIIDFQKALNSNSLDEVQKIWQNSFNLLLNVQIKDLPTFYATSLLFQVLSFYRLDDERSQLFVLEYIKLQQSKEVLSTVLNQLHHYIHRHIFHVVLESQLNQLNKKFTPLLKEKTNNLIVSTEQTIKDSAKKVDKKTLEILKSLSLPSKLSNSKFTMKEKDFDNLKKVSGEVRKEMGISKMVKYNGCCYVTIYPLYKYTDFLKVNKLCDNALTTQDQPSSISTTTSTMTSQTTKGEERAYTDSIHKGKISIEKSGSKISSTSTMISNLLPSTSNPSIPTTTEKHDLVSTGLSHKRKMPTNESIEKIISCSDRSQPPNKIARGSYDSDISSNSTTSTTTSLHEDKGISCTSIFQNSNLVYPHANSNSLWQTEQSSDQRISNMTQEILYDALMLFNEGGITLQK